MKLVLFDFDGVLIDTFIISLNITREVNKEISLETYRSIFDGNLYESLKNNPKVKMHPGFFELYEKQSRELKIPEQLKDLLYRLKKNYSLAIVSSTPSHMIENILKQENVRDCFSDIFGADIHTSKVVKIKMLLAKHKVAPEGAVFITDTSGDVLEARECGVESIAVTWGFHDVNSLKKAKPARIISDPEDLLGAIEKVL